MLKQNSYVPSISILNSLVNFFLFLSQKAHIDCDKTELRVIYKHPLKIQSSNLPLRYLNTAANYLIDHISLWFEEHLMTKEKAFSNTI